MAQDRHFWVLDDRVLKYVRFNEFHWWELLVIAGSLAALAGYAFLALFLDRRARARRRRQQQLARLERWLEAWQLDRDEEQGLYEMAGAETPLALYATLADPSRFEAAVHATAEAGKRPALAERVRDALGYHSDNLSIPVASTRQLLPGDHFRFSVWEEGRPQHHYGIVTAVSPAGIAVELTEGGYKSVTGTGGEVDLFYLRGNDVEYRFPFSVRSADAERNRLLLNHRLVQGGHRARSTRLPMLRPITFRLHTQLAGLTAQDAERGDESAATEPPSASGQELRGALLEMSEGGLSMVIRQPIAEGAYVAYDMPLPRGRMLPIVARVLDCRPFSGDRWLVRCELRGLRPTQRNALSQVLRLEQQQRLRAMQAERRRRRREENSP